MSKRLSVKEIKHDIREDEVRTFLARIFETLAERPMLVAGAVGAVVVVALLAAGAFAYLEGRREAAIGELTEAIEIYQPPADEEAAEAAPDPAADEERRAEAKVAFEKIRGGVGASVAGEVAELYLADIALAEGDAEKARQIWQDFLAQDQDHILAQAVRLNLIHLDRDSGRGAEVAAELEAELDDPARTLPEDVLIFELAETRKALGESAAAVELYQRILDEFPQSAYAARARQMTTSAGP